MLRILVIGLALSLAILPASSVAAPIGDCSLGQDVDDANLVLELPFTCAEGHVNAGFRGDFLDTFEFNVPERIRLHVTVTNDLAGTSGVTRLLASLFGPDAYRSAALSASQTKTLGLVIDTPGIWRLQLEGQDLGNRALDVPYHFSAIVLEAPPQAFQNDCGSGRDAGYAGSAIQLDLTSAVACTGALFATTDPDGYGDDADDGYAFHVPEKHLLVARVVPNATLGACVTGGLEQICGQEFIEPFEAALHFVYGGEGTLDLNRGLTSSAYAITLSTLPPVV